MWKLKQRTQVGSWETILEVQARNDVLLSQGDSGKVLTMCQAMWHRLWYLNKMLSPTSRKNQLLCVCMCVYVCNRERETETETERQRQRGRERGRQQIGWCPGCPMIRESSWNLVGKEEGATVSVHSGISHPMKTWSVQNACSTSIEKHHTKL